MSAEESRGGPGRDGPEEARRVLVQALLGRGAHVLVRDALDGLDWQEAGRRLGGEAHSIFQIVNHLVYWQDFAVVWIGGARPEDPEHAAESWPGAVAPSSESEWIQAAEDFARGLDELERRALEGELFEPVVDKTPFEILQLIASHNSYHLGQIAWIRRSRGAWPPPGGGATW